MKRQNTEKASEAVSRMRRLLGDWLRSSAESREPVAEMLDLLEVVDGFIREDRPEKTSQSSPATAGRSSDATYTIDKKRNDEEVLSEHRSGGSSQPFRCPRYLYDTIAKVLAHADEPMEFAEITFAVSKIYPDPAEFQLRAALRFMLSVMPPLLARDRNRYRPVRGGKFEVEAKGAWAALAKATK